jgi:tripartite-type tricarboxylate transporter receptor subunit TctC
MKRQTLKKLTLIGALLLGAALPAMAQEWPKKQPIKIVIGYNAGGGGDVLARITAEYLQRRLGQPVIVENKPGAGTAIAVDAVAKAAPDGYTLLMIYNDLVVLPAVRSNLPYKFDELTFLTRPFTIQPMIWGSPKQSISTATELVSYMKANPGKARYGSAGIGSVLHLGSAMFLAATGGNGVHVPYTGIAPVYQDLLAGNIEFSQGTPPSPDGVKALASVGSKRNPTFPNVATLQEMGIQNATWDAWAGFLAPPNMPKALADRLIAELGAVFKDPEAIAKYQSSGKLTPDAAPLTGETFKKQALDEHKGWKTVVDREKIAVQ